MPQHHLKAPALAPDVFGDIPEQFSVYYNNTNQDKSTCTRYFFLSDDSKPAPIPFDWTNRGVDITLAAPTTEANIIKPAYAFEIRQGKDKTQMTLYNGPVDKDQPLALAGNESSFRSTPIIGMPPVSKSPNGNKIVPVDESSKDKKELWTFASRTSSSSFLENFQWRCVDKTGLQRELVRLEPGSGLQEELVGKWSAEQTRIVDDTSTGREEARQANIKLGTFMFEGAGRGRGLGSYWRLMAIMTLLRMNQKRWEVKTPLGSRRGMGLRASKMLVLGYEAGLGLVGGVAFN